MSEDSKKKDAVEELFYRLLCVHLLVCEFTRAFASVEAEESVQSALGAKLQQAVDAFEPVATHGPFQPTNRAVLKIKGAGR